MIIQKNQMKLSIECLIKISTFIKHNFLKYEIL